MPHGNTAIVVGIWARSVIRQRGVLVELRIVFGVVAMFLIFFVVGLTSGKGLMISLRDAGLPVIGITAFVLILGFFYAAGAYIKEWVTTPAAVRAVSRRDALSRLEKLAARGRDINARNHLGYSALHVICDSYDPVMRDAKVQIVDFLIAHGADVEALTPLGETPLCLAVQRSAGVDVTKRLLAAGASSDAALRRAVWSRSSDASAILVLLLEAGASLTAFDDDGDTPLHWAARLGTLETMRVLIERGSGVRAVNHRGETPLHQVLQRYDGDAPENVAMVRLLVASGADVNAVDHAGRTPVAIARESKKVKLMAALKAAETGG